ncbi:AAA family ATPase [Schaalia vaccimaxillae]|uniref:AAA family ATPase n=1 Tax=Schaalia vaccimaxillae TaxID=183916 RepID=UPI0003B5AE01|nr:AAA family ATPase [Schaalia vaccimaxillae]
MEINEGGAPTRTGGGVAASISVAEQVVDLVVERLRRGDELRVLGLTGPPGTGKTTVAALVADMLRARGVQVAGVAPMDGFHMSNAVLDESDRHDRKGAPDTFDVWGFVALLRRLRSSANSSSQDTSSRGTPKTPPKDAQNFTEGRPNLSRNFATEVTSLDPDQPTDSVESAMTAGPSTPAPEAPVDPTKPQDPRIVLAPDYRRDLHEPVAASVPILPTGIVITEGNYLGLDQPGWREVRELIDLLIHIDTPDADVYRRLVARHEAFGRDRAEAAHWTRTVDAANVTLVNAHRGRADAVVWARESQKADE